jgi:hypothetical protein
MNNSGESRQPLSTPLQVGKGFDSLPLCDTEHTCGMMRVYHICLCLW